MKKFIAGIVALVLAMTCIPMVVKAEEPILISSAPTSFSISIADPEGDDYGPGWYTYPTNAVFKAGDFDLLGFELKAEGDNYVATFKVANIDNPWGGATGFSKQTFFLFFSTGAEGGSTKGVEGTNVSFAENFKWNIGLQIEGWESKIYTAAGDTITSTLMSEVGITATTVVEDEAGGPGEVVVTIPKAVLGELNESSKFIAWVTGQDGYGTNRLRGYAEEAGEWSFGGGTESSPKVMDMVVPEGMKQEDILNYKDHTVALPGILVGDYMKPTFTSLSIADPEGDDYGPGWYTYPTNAVFKAGDFDLLGFELKAEGDNYVATFKVANIDNPWGGATGFSKQTFFLFFSTGAEGGSTKGVEGTNVSFAENFKWNIGLQIEGWESKIYTAAGDTITSTLMSEAGITATTVVEDEAGGPGEVVVTIPKAVLGELNESSKFIAWVTGQDGYGTNRLRGYAEEAGEWSFGGGTESSPKVMDMVVPEGMKQEDILNYKDHTVALPGILVGDYMKPTFTSLSIADPEGDDYGPGWYTYPTNAVFKAGDFDLLGFELKAEGDNYVATFKVANIDNPWGGATGFSKQTFFLFFSTGAEGGSTKGVEGTNVSFAENFKWNIGLQIEGWESKIYTAAGDTITSTLMSEAGITATTVVEDEAGGPGEVVVTIPKAVLGELNESSKFIAWVTGQDGYGTNRLRGYAEEAGEWSFGGGTESSPKVMDMVVPEGMKQEDILNYKDHTVALPGISIADFLPSVTKVRVLAPQDGTVTNQLTVDLKIKVLVENLTKIVIGEQSFDVTSGENDIPQVALPNEGENVISIMDENGNQLAQITVIRDTTPPTVSIEEPKEGVVLTDRKVAVKLQTEPNVKVTLSLSAPDGSQADVINTSADSSGKVSVDVAFRAFVGLNIMKVTVTDSAGNSAVAYRLFAYDRPHTAILTIGSKQMDVNVDSYELDVAPYIKNGYTMVPLRFVAEAFGAKVGWDDGTKTVDIDFAGHHIKVVIGSAEAVVDDETVTMPLPAEIVNSRTMVPVRFISEAFGFTVKWDDSTKVITVTYP